jgi:hypothetical protein
VPETWLPSETLMEKLNKNACTVFTVTNHNNARSCYTLQDKGIDPLQFCSDPYRKSISGGSDCHMGIFVGITGTYLHVPRLKERLETESRSQLALEAIRKSDNDHCVFGLCLSDYAELY